MKQFLYAIHQHPEKRIDIHCKVTFGFSRIIIFITEIKIPIFIRSGDYKETEHRTHTNLTERFRPDPPAAIKENSKFLSYPFERTAKAQIRLGGCPG